MEPAKSRPNHNRKKRKAHPKVRTGCFTCKIRRVKCGEEKPVCLRCAKFGIECDGYATPQRGKHVNRPIIPSSRALPPLLLQPTASGFIDEQERSYFELFCFKTAFAILPRFEADWVRLMLLQACETEPCIRHGIIAIGALHRTSKTIQSSENLSFICRTEKPNEHYTDALRQYDKAIRQMRAAATGGKMDLRITLLKCLLVLTFEAWSGNDYMAAQQIAITIGMIQEWRAKNGKSSLSLQEFIAATPNIVEDRLIQIFSHMAIPSILLTQRIAPEAREILNNEIRCLESDFVPEVFTSFREAYIHHAILLRRSTSLFSFCLPDTRSEDPDLHQPKAVEDTSLITKRQNLMKNVSLWFKAFNPLSQACKDMATVEWLQSRMLRAQLLGAYASQCVMFTFEEILYDSCTHTFKEIVEICTEALTARRRLPYTEQTNFSLSHSFIIPLYMTVLKCRDRTIRRDAIAILLATQWREGVWDSFVAGHVGHWVMQVEEEFLEDDYVPGWARIAKVILRANLRERTADLACRQRISALSDETRIRKARVAW